jgi:hypothetical protein
MKYDGIDSFNQPTTYSNKVNMKTIIATTNYLADTNKILSVNSKAKLLQFSIA